MSASDKKRPSLSFKVFPLILFPVLSILLFIASNDTWLNRNNICFWIALLFWLLGWIVIIRRWKKIPKIKSVPATILLASVIPLGFLTGCNIIVNKFAFHPDTKYEISKENIPHDLQEIFITTNDQIKIQCFYLPNNNSDQLLVYFHGNGGNISRCLYAMRKFNQIGVNVLGVGYRGYGKSQGKPSEKGIYLDGEAALKYATEDLGFPTNKIILFGRSLGTTVAINTAQNQNLLGLILVTPLTNGKQYAKASGLNAFSSLAGKSFNNISKIPNIQCPLLVIHGTEDRVIPFEMGVEIYNEATVEKQFIKIEGGGHNNLPSTFGDDYWPSLNNFTRTLMKPS